MNYTLKFQNHSKNVGDVCIYQTDPTFDKDINVMSLAWFAKRTHPETNVKFQWDINYNFVWSETANLKAGVIFEACQVVDVDLIKSNVAIFDYDQDAFMLKPSSNRYPGIFQIIETNNIPFNRASVGIGMAGSGAFVKPAQPNMNMIYVPHPEYWITFGNFQQGEVIDITEITNKQKIVFQPNQYSITVILKQDNTWEIV